MSETVDKQTMRRVLVLGCSGTGKTTFTNRLAAKTALPKIHLDQEYFQPGWEPMGETAWQARVADIAERDAWIIDGSFGDTLPVRVARADTIIFFRLPRWLCLYRVLGRTIRNYGQVREDFAPGCPERFDLEFLKFVWNYRRDKEPQIWRALETFSGPIIHFANRRDPERFLEDL